jgi:hypothetical protein
LNGRVSEVVEPTFIHGIEDDARDVVDHLARFLARG